MDIPQKTRNKVKERSKGMCEAQLLGCVFEAAEIHHLLLRSRGGKHELSNLLHCCSICHKNITEAREGTEAYRFSRYDSPEDRAFKESVIWKFKEKLPLNIYGQKN